MQTVASMCQEGSLMTNAATKFARAPVAWAAAMGVAIVIGLTALFGTRLIGNEASPTPFPSGSAEASPSESVGQTFKSETSLGTIEWTKLQSATRIYAVDVGGDTLGIETRDDGIDAGWWILSEGPSWQPTAAPAWGASVYLGVGTEMLAVVSPDGHGVTVGPSSFREVIGRSWTDNPGDPGIYRRDGEAWVNVPLPPAQPVAPAGVVVRGSWFEGAAAKDDSSWIAPLVSFVEIPWYQIYRERLPKELSLVEGHLRPIWDNASQRLDIYVPRGGPGNDPLASLTVELVPGDVPIIQFRDASTRELVHEVAATLPGWTAQAQLEAYRGWGLDDISFIVAHDGEITVVRPPWPMGEEWWNGIVSAAGRYYTLSMPLGEGYSATAIHIWESADGLEWTEVNLPQLSSGVLDHAQLFGGTHGLLLTVHGMLDGSQSVWASTDGRTWRQGDVDPSLVGIAFDTDLGWMMPGTYATAALSRDGLTWEAVDLPPLTGEPSVQYMNGLLLFGPEPERTGYEGFTTWVARLAR
jgi:hypothetical protein